MFDRAFGEGETDAKKDANMSVWETNRQLTLF